jgi:2-oxoglutarate ferredoxin oxidoreductase subunit beta
MDLTYLVLDNQIYGLTKGQLSPTSAQGSKTSSSFQGSFEEPVNPLLYLLAYGAGFVAQGTPADINQLAKLVEEAIRYPGFAFVNIQSPCVTFGEDENQLKAQRERMRPLEADGHDPSNRLRAMDLAQDYGSVLRTGVFYRNPAPAPTFESRVRELQQSFEPAPEIEDPRDLERDPAISAS